MGDLKPKLKDLADAIMQSCEQEFDRTCKDLSKDFAAILNGDVICRDANGEMLRFWVQGIDAADYILSRWKTLEIRDFNIPLRVKGDVESIREFLRDDFESREVPDRGFIYVAWSQRPEVFSYIGKTISSARVINSHVKLIHSLTHSSTLSLIFPQKATEGVLRDLEASVIYLALMSSGIKNNKQLPSPPFGKGTKVLNELRDALEQQVWSLKQ